MGHRARLLKPGFYLDISTAQEGELQAPPVTAGDGPNLKAGERYEGWSFS